MEHRLSRFGVAVTLGLLVTVFALLFMVPVAATYAEALQRPRSDTVVVTRTIGTGTTTSNYPFYNYYKNGKSQMLYLGSEIGFSGSIRRVAYDISRVATSYQTLPNFTIRMMEIPTATFNAAYLDASAATVVYGGTGYSETLPSVTGWVWFDITDFNFHADKNLLIEITFGTLGSYASTYYQVNGTTTAGYQTAYGYSDTVYPPNYSNQTTTRPNLRFEVETTPAPLYAAIKSVAPSGTRYTGDVVTYTVAFTNTGILTGSASLSDPLPAGAQVVPGSVTGGAVYSEALNAVVWSPISLAVNNSVTTTFRVTLTATNGSVTNTATISDAAIATSVSASAANAIAVADFSSSAKTISSANMHPTGLVTYTVVLYNSVAAITATATMTDPIPVGAAYLSGSASVQGGGTLVADTTGITWAGTVTGGQRITVTFGVSLTALTGNVANTAYINSPNINALVTKVASLPVQPYSAGPTPFGYIYQDSYAPDGPAFTWVEPLTTSKLLTFASGGTNDGYYQVNLPFPLAFYTNIYTQVYPSTNGLVGFGAGSTAATNATIPNATVPNNFASCYWDDLRIWSTNPITEGVYYEVQGIAPNRQAIFTFALEDTFYTQGAYPPYRFQMVLSESTNQITCQYQQMTSAAPHGTGQSATAGIENVTGTEGLLYFYGSGTTFPAPIEDRLAIRYTPPQRPNYAFAKTVQPAGLVYPGQVLTYSLTITNYGGLNGTATISDPLPAGVVFVGPVPGDPLQPVFDGYAVTWTGLVPLAQSVTVRFLAGVLPSLAGSITNTATISDSLIPTPLTAQVSNSVARSIYTTSSKAVTPAGVVNQGQLLTYTVNIINSGTLSGMATLIDTPVAGTTYAPGSAVIVSGGGAIIEDSTTITWTGTVTNGATIQVRLNALVSGNYGVITNTATITDPMIAAPVYVSVANTIASPNLSASTKTANPSIVQVGGALTYTVLVKNTGALTSTAASLTDALLPQFTLDPAKLSASSGVVTGTASSVSWNGTVAPGATVAVTIPVVVSNDCCGQSLANTAVISDPVLPAPVLATSAPVLIYGPYSQLNESFEGSFPPIGWASTVVTATGSPAWTQVITGDYPVIGPYVGTYMAKFNSYNVSAGGAARLSSGPVSLVGVNTPVLHFAMYHDNDPTYMNNLDRIQVQVSTDGGLTYQNVGAPIVRYATTASWQIHAVDLSAYSGQTIRLGFLAISAYGNNMFIDAVGINACGLAPAGVSFTFDPTSPLAGQSIDFDGTVSSGTAPFTYTWDFGDGSPLTTGDPITHSYVVAGTYPVTLTVTNPYGSASYSTSVVVSAAPTPPTLGALQSSAPTALGNATYFTGTLLAGSTPITYTWDFGDGTVVEDGLNITHTFSPVGLYTITLTAVNVAGTDVATSTLSVGLPPTASFDATNPTYYPNATTFTFTGNPGTGPTTYLWTLSNGLTNTVEFFTATLAASAPINNYTSTLRVSNPYGSAITSTVVTVLNTSADLGIAKSDAPDPVGGTQALTYTLAISNFGPNALIGAPIASFPFTNTGLITIPTSGTGTPYPSLINVAGITDPVGKVRVTLYNITHTYPDDIQVMLVNPGGQAVLLMANAGGGSDINNIALTFDDNAANSLPDSAQITSGTYKPTYYGTPGFVGPYATKLSAFAGANPDGAWGLYVADIASPDSGVIAGGWSLELTTVAPLTTTVVDTLPTGYAFGSASGSGWTCANVSGTVTCTRGILPVGAAPNIIITGNAPFLATSGDITNTATVASVLPDFNSINNTATITTFVNALPAQLTVNVVGNGMVSQNPLPPYVVGDVVTLTATPATGWSFVGWSGDLTGTTNPAAITLTADKVVTATFTHDPASLTVNVVGSGAVVQTPQLPYFYGDVVTLTATADSNWAFAGWSGDLNGTTNPITITLTGSNVVTATFTHNSASLTVNKIGNGTVDQTPQPSYGVGDVVTLTATADLNWAFAGWSGDLNGTTNPITITLTGSNVITATFTHNPVNLTVNVVGSGAVDQTPQSPYFYGDVVTLTANAATNWTFAGWSGDLSGTTNPITITLTDNNVVTATFAATCVPVSDVDFTYTPIVPQVNKIVTFNGTALTGTAPITYSWNFGDGFAVGSGSPITHLFPITPTAQSYTVTLTMANVCSSPVAVSKLVAVQPMRVYLPLILK